MSENAGGDDRIGNRAVLAWGWSDADPDDCRARLMATVAGAETRLFMRVCRGVDGRAREGLRRRAPGPAGGEVASVLCKARLCIFGTAARLSIAQVERRTRAELREGAQASRELVRGGP